MSAINFPDPSQSPWNNPDTGITYIFVDGCWKAATSTFGDLSTYASLSGATFTGRLDAPEINSMGTNGFYAKNPNNTFGYVLRGVDYLNNHTCEILLDGSAMFDGNITSKGITQYALPTISNGGQLGYDDATKSLRFYSNSSTNSNSKVQFHFNQSGTSDITFNEGGSASFASGQAAITAHGSHSGVRVQSTSDATSVGEFFAGYRGSSMAFQVTTGGALKAASGAFEVDDSGIIQTNINTAGIVKLNSTADFANPKIELSSIDGSAEFAGSINIGTWANTSDSAIYMVNQANSGQIVVKGDGTSTASAFSVYSGGWSGSSNQVAAIKADGSATFAGQINIGDNPGAVNEAGARIYSEGSITLSRGTDQTSRVIGVLNIHGYPTCEIYPNGSATFAGAINGTTVGTSDIKFKENIEAAPTQLADIEAFELKTFDWKDSAPLSDELKSKQKLGLIAQEVEAICPEMVYEVAGQDEDSYKAINHDVLIMKLLGAVKELSTKVAALEAG